MAKKLASLLALVFALCSMTAARAAVIAPASGAALCGALTVADFQAVGLSNASPPSANVQDKGASAYCVYAGKSSATGGIELDVFYPAGNDLNEAKATEVTASDESSGGHLQPIALPGVDSAHWSPNAVSGGPAFATIVVRRSTLVFVLGIPAGKNSQSQLLKLSELLLKRF